MNLLITNKCNQKCPYCFLEGNLDSVDKAKEEIGIDNFEIAIKYAQELIDMGGKKQLNLLGGEPTLHSRFEELLRKAIYQKTKDNNDVIFPVYVFSNGLFHIDLARFLAKEPCGLLLNINEPGFYPSNTWDRLEKNIVEIGTSRSNKKPVCLSINLYKPEQDFSYIISLAQKSKLKYIRADIARPNIQKNNRHIAMNQISEMIPTFVALADECSKKDITLITDCCLPVCTFKDEDLKKLIDKGISLNFSCCGAIDVNTDLEVWYCIPMRALKFGKLTDYKSARELALTLENRTHALKWINKALDKCELCKWRTLKICQGGCLALKEIN